MSFYINDKFASAPVAYELSDKQFRVLIRAVAYLSEWSEHKVKATSIKRIARCSSRTIEKLVDLGLLIRDEHGHFTPSTEYFRAGAVSQSRANASTGWTYLIQRSTDGPVKIGCTHSNPLRRMSALQTGHDVRLRLIGAFPNVAKERELHATHASLRLAGEWFDPSVLDLIDRTNLRDGSEF